MLTVFLKHDSTYKHKYKRLARLYIVALLNARRMRTRVKALVCTSACVSREESDLSLPLVHEICNKRTSKLFGRFFINRFEIFGIFWSGLFEKILRSTCHVPVGHFDALVRPRTSTDLWERRARGPGHLSSNHQGHVRGTRASERRPLPHGSYSAKNLNISCLQWVYKRWCLHAQKCRT